MNGLLHLNLLLGAQGDRSHQVMPQHVPQHGGFHLGAASHAELLKPPIAGDGVDALGRGGTFLVNLLRLGT